MCVCVHAKLLQLCLTLSNPMDCSPPGFYVHMILQGRILEWVAIPFSREPSWPRDRTHISYICCVGRQFFTTSATWEILKLLYIGKARRAGSAGHPKPFRMLEPVAREGSSCQWGRRDSTLRLPASHLSADASRSPVSLPGLPLLPPPFVALLLKICLSCNALL